MTNYLIQSFLVHSNKEALIDAVKAFIKSIQIIEYDYEKYVDNIISIIAGDKQLSEKDLDTNKIYESVRRLFDNIDCVDKDSIKVTLVDNIYNRCQVQYRKVGENYNYNTILYELEKFKK